MYVCVCVIMSVYDMYVVYTQHTHSRDEIICITTDYLYCFCVCTYTIYIHIHIYIHLYHLCVRGVCV